MLTNERGAFRWLRKQQGKFAYICRALVSALVLALHDSEHHYILFTDVSDMAMAGIPAQMQPWGADGRLVERPQQ
jgi:hypothetical protein